MFFYIFDDDIRYKYVSEYLLKNNFIKTKSLKSADVILLPFIISENKKYFDDYFFSVLKKDVKLFFGLELKDDELKSKLLEKNISFLEIMKNDIVRVKNSVATAEGVLEFIISNFNETIYNSNFLVLGYGVCGERLSNNIKNLGGNITIFEKEELKIGRAKLNNFKTIDKISNLNYDVLINTIPYKIIENKLLNDKILIIDISSEPYGFDLEYAKSNNIKINVLKKIPSIFAYKTSGYIIGEYILKNS